MVTIKVKVKPNSNKTEILDYDPTANIYTIAVASPPDRNKANTTLIKFLSKHFNKQARIVTGKTSKVKLIKLS